MAKTEKIIINPFTYKPVLGVEGLKGTGAIFQTEEEIQARLAPEEWLSGSMLESDFIGGGAALNKKIQSYAISKKEALVLDGMSAEEALTKVLKEYAGQYLDRMGRFESWYISPAGRDELKARDEFKLKSERVLAPEGWLTSGKLKDEFAGGKDVLNEKIQTYASAKKAFLISKGLSDAEASEKVFSEYAGQYSTSTGMEAWHISPTGREELIANGEFKPRKNPGKAPIAPKGWKTGRMLDQDFIGGSNQANKIQAYATAKKEALISEGIAEEDADILVFKRYAGWYTRDNGHAAWHISPTGCDELIAAGQLQSRTEKPPLAPADWITSWTLGERFVNVTSERLTVYAAAKRSALMLGGMDEDEAEKVVFTKYAGLYTSRTNQPAWHISPAAQEELIAKGEFKERLNNIPLMPKGWLTANTLEEDFIGYALSFGKKIEDYVAAKKQALISLGMDEETAETKVFKEYAGWYVSRGTHQGWCISPEGKEELSVAGELRLKSLKAPLVPDDWSSPYMLAAEFTGHFLPKIVQDYAATKQQALMLEGMGEKEAKAKIFKEYAGWYTGRTGKENWHISPAGTAELIAQGKLVLRRRSSNEITLAPEDWLTSNMLTNEFIGGGETLNRKVKDFAGAKQEAFMLEGMSEDEAAAKVLKEYAGWYLGKSGAECWHISPAGKKELQIEGVLRLKNEKAPPAPADWITSSSLAKEFVGSETDLGQQIQEYASKKELEYVQSGTPPEEASKKVFKEWAGVYTNKNGNMEVWHVSPLGKAEMKARTMLSPRLDRAPIAPDNWVTGSQMMSEYVGGNVILDQKIRAYAAEKQEAYVQLGIAEEAATEKVFTEFAGWYANKTGQEAWHVSPLGREEMQTRGILAHRSERAPLAPENWSYINQLEAEYVGSGNQLGQKIQAYAAAKKEEYIQANMAAEEAERKVFTQSAGIYTNKKGQQGWHVSPSGKEEMRARGILRLQSERAPFAPKGWVTGCQLINDYVGSGETLEQKIQTYAEEKKTAYIDSGMPQHEASKKVFKESAGLYTTKGGLEVWHVSPLGKQEMQTCGMLKPRAELAPKAPKDWISTIQMKNEYVGSHRDFEIKGQSYAAEKEAEFIRAGISPAEAAQKVSKEFIGIYTGKAGKEAWHISPVAKQEMQGRKMLRLKSERAPLAPEGWTTPTLLADDYVGSSKQIDRKIQTYVSAKEIEYTQNGMQQQEATQKVCTELAGFYTSKLGQEVWHLSPAAKREMTDKGLLKLRTERAPAAPNGWMASHALKDDYVGGNVVHNQKIESYAARKKEEFIQSGVPPAEASQKVFREFAGVYTGKIGRETWHISPIGRREMHAKGLLTLRSEQMPTVPDGWFTAFQLENEYVGNNKIFSEKMRTYAVEKKGEYIQQGIPPEEAEQKVFKESVGLYIGKMGRPAWHVSPSGKEDMYKKGIFKLRTEQPPLSPEGWVNPSQLRVTYVGVVPDIREKIQAYAERKKEEYIQLGMPPEEAANKVFTEIAGRYVSEKGTEGWYITPSAVTELEAQGILARRAQTETKSSTGEENGTPDPNLAVQSMQRGRSSSKTKG